jgi:hypothetical protein
VIKPVCGVNVWGASESPNIQLTSSPALVSAMELEVALVVYVPGLGLVMAETTGACAVFEPVTAKKCTNIGSWLSTVIVIVSPAGHDDGFCT